MNILLVCEYTNGSDGWSTYARNLETSLRARGHAVTVCGREPLGRPISYLVNPLCAFLGARRLRRIIAKEQPDIVHVTVEPYILAWAFLDDALAQRTVLTIHGSYGVRLFMHWQTRWLAKRAMRKIAQFITVSNYTKETVRVNMEKRAPEVSEHFARHARVVISGVEKNTWRGENIQKTKKHILTVGGIKPRKGILASIEALAAYKRKYGTPFRFTIVGNAKEGSAYTNEVRQRIDALGLRDCVTITGIINDATLQEYYANADLYLMPAKTTHDTFEGFGLVYLEAASFGVPCIGPNGGGAVEAIRNGETGYTVDPLNAEEIAERIHAILDEGAIHQDACRVWAAQHSLERMVEGTETVYRSLLSTDTRTGLADVKEKGVV